MGVISRKTPCGCVIMALLAGREKWVSHMEGTRREDMKLSCFCQWFLNQLFDNMLTVFAFPAGKWVSDLFLFIFAGLVYAGCWA